METPPSNPKKIRAEHRPQLGLISFGIRLGLPSLKRPLRLLEQRADIPDAQAVSEHILALFGHQIDLVAKVDQRGVDRRCRKHQHLCFRAFLNHLFQQPRVPAVANLAVVARARLGVVAKIVRLVNDHQIEIAPVEMRQIDVACAPAVAGQVRMREQGVPKAIRGKGIVNMGVRHRIQGPVFAQFFRAQDQHALVSQLEELDRGQRGVGLAQAHAIGQNAPVVPQQAGNRAFGPVLLKTVQGIPNFSIVKMRLCQLGFPVLSLLDICAEQLVQRLKINKLRRVILADAV